MYARLLLLRSSKLGCFPRRLASSSSGPRVPEQAVRAIFLIFRLSFLPRTDRSIWPGPGDPDDWLTCASPIQFLTPSVVRVFQSNIVLDGKRFLSNVMCNYNETIKSRRVVWREWILPEGRRCFLKLFVFLSLEILERKKYITMFVQLKWYETDLGQNFEE